MKNAKYKIIKKYENEREREALYHFYMLHASTQQKTEGRRSTTPLKAPAEEKEKNPPKGPNHTQEMKKKMVPKMGLEP